MAAFNQEYVDSPEGLIIRTELIIGTNTPHPIKELVNKVRIALRGIGHTWLLWIKAPLTPYHHSIVRRSLTVTHQYVYLTDDFSPNLNACLGDCLRLPKSYSVPP